MGRLVLKSSEPVREATVGQALDHLLATITARHRSPPPAPPPNPDPRKYELLDRVDINGRSIVLVRYDGCTTFGGRKLLLLSGIYQQWPELDPHLLGGGHPVIARFEPEAVGWHLAKICAQAMNPPKK